MEKFNTKNSEALYQEICQYLVDGVSSSFHKAAVEDYPIAMTHGKGSKLYDVDGNEYIDYIGGFGPMIMGYAPDAVNAAVKEQVDRGSQFSTPTRQLLELSKKLTEIIPCAEMVSFQSSGTEANMHAWRVARAYTGKQKIVKFAGQYHGWSDEQKISITANAKTLGDEKAPARIMTTAGQRQETADDIIITSWNRADILEALLEERGNEIARCCNGSLYVRRRSHHASAWLSGKVRELCTKYHVVLIFDEVITGFRMSLGGAQQYFGVTPDMGVFGKAIAGGYSLSMVCGKKEIMNCGVHPSGTFNATPISVAAALATIKELSKPGVYEKMDELGELFCEKLRALGKKHGVALYTEHHGGIIQLEMGMERAPKDYKDYLENVDSDMYDRLYLLTRDYGVRITSARGRIYLTTEHTEEDILKTMEVFDHVLPMLKA